MIGRATLDTLIPVPSPNAKNDWEKGTPFMALQPYLYFIAVQP